MRARRWWCAAGLVALSLGAGAPMADAGVDEKVGAQLPLELAFTGSDGAPVRLGDAFGDGKPVVLTLAYYHCSMLCPLVLRGTAALVRGAAPRPGADYHLLTVSIDPRDRPEDARMTQAEVLAMAGEPGESAPVGGRGAGDPNSLRSDIRSPAPLPPSIADPPGSPADWRFWTAGESEVRQLADALGFRYRYDPKSDQFAHPAVVFVLTPQGRISRYLYGVDVPRAQFEAALATAARGESGSSFERILLRCFHYVPALRRYGGFVTGSLRGSAVLILLGLIGGVTLLSRRVRRRAGS